MTEHEVDAIQRRLERMEGKIDNLGTALADVSAKGCARAPQHEDLERRVRVLEGVANRAIGFGAAAGGLGGAIAGMVAKMMGG